MTGVVVDPPAATVSDVRRIAQKNLAAGGRTLIVYLDGFGWDQYVEGKRAGLTPAMAELPARRALTVFPTITPVTFAAMVSGEDPSVHRRPRPVGPSPRLPHDLLLGRAAGAVHQPHRW